MHPRDLIHKALTAASVAEAQGFHETSRAFQDLAFAIFGEPNSPAWADMLVGPDRVEDQKNKAQ